MDRRTFLKAAAAAMLVPSLKATDAESRANLQYCLLEVGKSWNSRRRALVQLSFEIQKRCNIPVETHPTSAPLKDVTKVMSPFFIIVGDGAFPAPSFEEARTLRLVLNSGGMLVFDDHSGEEDTGFYESAKAMMRRVYPELEGPEIVPNDHAVFQSYYLLKEPRGRLNRTSYLEGWHLGNRTNVFFSHNDLFGAMEADQLGNWRHNMELGGGFRRELCFRLAINLSYYALTINYKKDRAFPPVIERRRRL